MGDAWNARIPSNSMPWLAVRLRRKFSANRPSDGYTPSTCPTSSIRKRRATSTMVRYRVVRRTLVGSATLPISRSSPPESAPSERMARSGRESRYLYRTAGLTLCSIRAGVLLLLCYKLRVPSMWGRLLTCAAVGYRRRSAANAGVPSGSGRLTIGRSLASRPTRSQRVCNTVILFHSGRTQRVGCRQARANYLRSIVTVALEALPERNVRGTEAAWGTPSGIHALTCVTPAYTRPANVAAHRGASMPPKFTLHGAAGAGYGAPPGSRPSATGGAGTPSPVRKKVTTEPGPGGTKSSLQEIAPPALALIATATPGFLGPHVKMPGAAAATATATGAVAMPWNSTCTCTLPLTAYGTMAPTWPATE